MQAREKLDELLRQKPGAMTRQGRDLFVPVPIYRAKKKYKPVYINGPLLKRLLNLRKELSWDEMAEIVGDPFNFTIEPAKGVGDPIGTAYADRQADPLDLSLSGNKGSGRAYYAGKIFNIKGEKTPLATSTQRKFSDGLLEMERCVWETLVANALQGSLHNGLSGVLAILDMNELCEVPWRDAPVKRGKIIRIDEDGALDRVTHAFYTQKPLSAAALKKTAAAYGRLEGDKFIERLVHGTWSPGNISLRGHLIDFDTVGAVKGRSPQYSSTPWYADNYFGYEHRGQGKILASLARHQVNKDGVPEEALRDIMSAEMTRHIEKGFVYLMGFAAHEKIYARYKKDIAPLCALWMELSRKGYKKMEGLSAKNALSPLLHAFDFSLFFRLYPLQKRAGVFSATDMARTISETSLAAPFRDKPEKPLTPIQQQHRDAVFDVIGGDFIDSAQELMLLKIALLQFIKDYDGLYTRIMKDMRPRAAETEARAYVINEDRFYMFPSFTLSYHLAQHGKTRPRDIDETIRALITASQRLPGRRIADLRLYREGFSYIELDGKGSYRKGFAPFGKALPYAALTLAESGRKTRLLRQKKSGRYLSGKMPMRMLLGFSYRDMFLLGKKSTLTSPKRMKTLKNFL